MQSEAHFSINNSVCSVGLEWQNKYYLQAKKDAMLLNLQKYGSPVGLGRSEAQLVREARVKNVDHEYFLNIITNSHTLDYIMTLSIYIHSWDHKALVNDIWTVRSHTLTTWMKMISQQIE